MSKHIEAMGDKWFFLLNGPKQLDDLIGLTLKEGGTRSIWTGIENNEQESILMAWPYESPLRSAVLVTGKKDGQLNPVTAFPLLEGYPNELYIQDSFAWKSGMEGEFSVIQDENADPIWFYNALYFRDKCVDFTDNKPHEFLLAGFSYGIRRALLDEITITEGPTYEAHVTSWLEKNEGKTRLDVPALKVSLSGTSIMSVTQNRSEYQARVTISNVHSFNFGPEWAETKIYCFNISVGPKEKPINIIIYASERSCLKGYVPEDGHEIDMIFWLQGRLSDPDEGRPADYDENKQTEKSKKETKPKKTAKSEKEVKPKKESKSKEKNSN